MIGMIPILHYSRVLLYLYTFAMVFWWIGYSFLHLDFGLYVSWTAKGHPKLWMLLDVMAESCSALAQWTYLHVLLLFLMRTFPVV